MILMIVEQGTKVAVNGGRVEIQTKDLNKFVPKELIESVAIFGNVQLSTAFVRHCLIRKIPVFYYSNTGKYFGRTISTSLNNFTRLEKQIERMKDYSFLMTLAYQIIEAKINNQKVVLRRYGKDNQEIQKIIGKIEQSSRYLCRARSLEELSGYEGACARLYFQGLSALMPEDFAFQGRSKQPPRDPFNSMISLGYTILLNEITGEIESVGLSPYGGFIHGHARNYPSLSSDLIEEYRAPLIDSLVIHLISAGKVSIDDFQVTEEGVFLDRKFLKFFLAELQKSC